MSKFAGIIDQVAGMSVIELSELVKALEEKFGVSAAAMAAPAAAAGAPAAAAVEEKSEFKVVLKEMGPDKIKTIKALREVTTLGLAEAKNLVESAPATIVESIAKDEAKKIKEKLEAAGAKVDLV
ncbi:50S ribosomal protein L7/L12 [bacterium]|jgi:large subunit ribosomal protein L7/L12|nr:50S ribosomal protein L7/L12 [bacterium]NBX78146.1 50S ribosomal protein L7/L12 [bacterium]